MFSDRRTYTVLIDTFAFAFVSLAVALGIGIPIAWIAERTDFRAKTLLFTLMAIGLLIPGFAVAMGWLFLLHPRIGLLNQLFQIVLRHAARRSRSPPSSAWAGCRGSTSRRSPSS